MTASLMAALTMGLFSSVHCLGMCGGIIGALTFGLPAPVRARRSRLLGFGLAYNLGRLCSYSTAGALAGGTGAGLAQFVDAEHGHRLMNGIAAGMLILIGLYVAGWFPQLSRFERLGLPLWRRLEPLGRGFLPVKSYRQALCFGAVWGWLPCGLVYSALIWATASGGAAQGALAMFAFGLGTLPLVLLAGISAGWGNMLLQKPSLRRILGLGLIAFATFNLAASLGVSLPLRHFHTLPP
jgi:sulfite exporter TauE/SafE